MEREASQGACGTSQRMRTQLCFKGEVTEKMTQENSCPINLAAHTVFPAFFQPLSITAYLQWSLAIKTFSLETKQRVCLWFTASTLTLRSKKHSHKYKYIIAKRYLYSILTYENVLINKYVQANISCFCHRGEIQNFGCMYITALYL